MRSLNYSVFYFEKNNTNGDNLMKKLLLIAAGILLCASPAHNVFAADLDQDDAGETVTVDASTVPGAQDIEFNPSTNVVMTGASEATSFAIGAYHEQALNKTAGQSYGMAADTNSIFFQDLSPAGTGDGTVTGTNASEFTTANGWFQM
jgi:hypothetical protein